VIVDGEQPDAVLLDVKLPDGSGISALDELCRRWPELVVIVITGYVRHEDAFNAGVKHAYGYVTKPIDQVQLRSLLEKALQDRAPTLSREDVRQYRRRFQGETRRDGRSAKQQHRSGTSCLTP
jgi:DNA-binding NtrC family response regulator